MKKYLVLTALVGAVLMLSNCSATDTLSVNEPNDAQVQQKMDEEVAKIFSIYSKAATSSDDAVVEEFRVALKEFDGKYGSDLLGDFNMKSGFGDKPVKLMLSSGSTSYPSLTDLPIKTDGAVYLSGGNDGAVSAVISWVSPSVTPGKFYHGAVLDLDKFDPTDLNSKCFETAILKGAGYETPTEWMKKPNVAVLNPNVSITKAALDNAQKALYPYCDPNNKDMQYGFFKQYVNIFNLVDKWDNYYWYCTKVVWRVYIQLGYDIDSNSPKVDMTTSGLYSIVKAYYKTIYFYNSSKANQKIDEYMANARKTIVLAEEIYYSSYLTKVYEKVRDAGN